jgi:hypothetical protein
MEQRAHAAKKEAAPFRNALQVSAEVEGKRQGRQRAFPFARLSLHLRLSAGSCECYRLTSLKKEKRHRQEECA